MRPLLLAGALASALVAGPALADDPTTTDVRCVIVAGTLAGQTDPDLQKLGDASLLYFWGRLEGRGQTANISARVSDEAAKMTADDIKAQVQTCGAMVSAAGQSLQALGEAVQARVGGGAGK